MTIALPPDFPIELFTTNIIEIVAPFAAIQAMICGFLVIKKIANHL